ncbi:MAG: TolC family protein [Acidobacteriota bacterium]|nr:TolC family protein [Acidobacteriota bacterium]
MRGFAGLRSDIQRIPLASRLLTRAVQLVCLALATFSAVAQQAAPPPEITLQDAIARAHKYGAQIESANIAAALAREDKVQARAAALPSLSALNQFLYTEGNGTPSGVFVANDGVHIYNEQAVVHEELFSLVRRGEIRVAAAAEAVAKAKLDVALRGLNVTVVQDYYSIASAGRKVANAQKSLSEAQTFLDITQKQERGGEVAHADVIKAQLQVQQRQRDVQDALLGVQKAKIALSVLIFPTLDLNYSIVDDLSKPAVLPPLPEVTAQATGGSPDLRAAQATVSQARSGVSVARYAYLPSLGLDFWYGIDANQFAARADNPVLDTGRSTLPHFEVPHRQNLGYSAAATLNIPVWNWGATHSKVKQAALRERQAELDLAVAQKQLQSTIASSYQEAATALSQVDSLRTSSELSAESLRLALLRYQAGEATALEVVDAQSTASLSRGAYEDGLLRSRVALANLQSLTGTF